MRYGLSDDVIERINTVFSHYPKISKVILYSSRAKGNYKEGSDIDLSIVGSGTDLPLLPYKIDLNIYEKIRNEELKEHIERVGKVIYDRDGDGS